MKTYNLKVLGCDNGSGELELGGDLDITQVHAKNVIDLGMLVVAAVFGYDCKGSYAEAVREVAKMRVEELTTTKCGEQYIVSFVDEDNGQAFVVAAKEVE